MPTAADGIVFFRTLLRFEAKNAGFVHKKEDLPQLYPEGKLRGMITFS